MLSGFRNFLLTFVISLIIFGLIAFVVVGIVLDAMGVSGAPDITPGEVTTYYENYTGSDTDNSSKILAELDGNSFNMLFVGLDYTPKLFYDIYNPNSVNNLVAFQSDVAAGSAAENGEYREIAADTIVLICVNKERSEFAFTAFSPATIVTVNGESICLSEVYETYGLTRLIECIHELTNLTVDRYAVVSMDDFPSIVDIIDGVDFNVPCKMVYDDHKGQLHINIAAGKQHLDGTKALQVLRFNSYEDTDGSRVKTTVAFIKAVLSKMTNPQYITKAAALFKQAEKMIITDFTAADLSSNLDLIFSYPSFLPVTIEPPGNYTTIEGRLCFIPNTTGCQNTFAPYKQMKANVHD